jgi:archaemetzincin
MFKNLLLFFFIIVWNLNASAQRIILLPLGKKIKDSECQKISAQLKNLGIDAKLLPAEDFPNHVYYKPRKRYRADKIIAWLKTRGNPNEILVGITNQDISTTHHGHYDFGVMGLGFRPGRACVASSFRLKNKNSFYKIILHEIGHNKGIPHCDSKNCMMMDAEKKDRTAEMIDFCVRCKKTWNQSK